MQVTETYYSRLFDEMNRQGVKYLVVGGLAVAFHGAFRITMDLDVAVDPDFDQTEAWERVIKEFGLNPRITTLPISEMANRENRVRLREEKNLIAYTLLGPTSNDPVLDILFDPPWDFRRAYATRKEVTIMGIAIPVVDIEHLISMKEDAAREKDLADIKALKAIAARRKGIPL